MKITLEDIKNIRIRRKPRFIDCLRVALGLGTIYISTMVFRDMIPDTRPMAGPCLVVFGLLFILWGMYPVCSKAGPSSNKFYDAYDRVMRFPQTPSQKKRVHVPGTNIRINYDNDDYVRASADFNVDEYLAKGLYGDKEKAARAEEWNDKHN